VTPDLALVPQKYHPFISSAVRRIYIDTDANTNTNTNNDTEGTDENLNVEIVRQAEEISHFHRRVITLERENAMLMDSAEANIRRAQACAEGERRAILERDEERGKIATLVQKMQKMEKELEKQIRL
jgi:23S rRNA maturation-related 3'-5' exoribonuclease YhaM